MSGPERTRPRRGSVDGERKLSSQPDHTSQLRLQCERDRSAKSRPQHQSDPEDVRALLQEAKRAAPLMRATTELAEFAHALVDVCVGGAS